MRALSYTVRQTTDEEVAAKMPYMTSSMMEAVNTCPKWGIINSVQGKAFTIGYRQMALEAGSLLHEVFSVINLYQVGVIQGCIEHMDWHGEQLFGKHRWDAIIPKEFYYQLEALIAAEQWETLQYAELLNLERLAYAVIATSDYYDDPEDRNRTLSNLEFCAIELINYWMMNLRNFNIYIEDRKNPQSRIGVEISFDVVFDIEYMSPTTGLVTTLSQRFIGLGDAVYQNTETKRITYGEYKSASRMGDAWRNNFQTRHQLTAYNACLAAYFDPSLLSMNTILIGSAVPVRKTTAPVQHFMVPRDHENVLNFLTTLLATTRSIETYEGVDALVAPMFTHSCSRYFVTCALLDLCSSSYSDQVVMYEQMLDKPELSPSEEKAKKRGG